MDSQTSSVNLDREIWRKFKNDYYSPAIFVSSVGSIGINVGGDVIVMPVEEWHTLAKKCVDLSPAESELEYCRCDNPRTDVCNICSKLIKPTEKEKWCGCGEPQKPGVVHRKDLPCYIKPQSPELPRKINFVDMDKPIGKMTGHDMLLMFKINEILDYLKTKETLKP